MIIKNKTLQIILFLIIGITSCACDGFQNPKKGKELEYYAFSKQITPNGKYAIYNYARYRKMSFSSDIKGMEIFDINKEFKERKGKAINGLIGEWISNDTLLVYCFDFYSGQPKDTLPIKTEFEKINDDFVIKRVSYKANSATRISPKFDSVFIKNDSIIIHRILDKNERKLISFPLGGVKILVKSDTIYKITTTQLHKTMDFSIKNPDGTYTDDLPQVGTITYEFTPIKKVFISKRGEKIFWVE